MSAALRRSVPAATVTPCTAVGFIPFECPARAVRMRAGASSFAILMGLALVASLCVVSGSVNFGRSDATPPEQSGHGFSLAPRTPGDVSRTRAAFATAPGSHASPVRSDQSLYNVTVNETGLPVGALWSVGVVNHTSPTRFIEEFEGTGSSIVAPLTNGTHTLLFTGPCCGPVSWIAYPPTTNVTVNGGPVNASATFGFGYFVEFGMNVIDPNANVTLNFYGWTVPLNGGGFGLLIPNGTWPFQVSQPSGYWISPRSGNVTVRGANTSISITESYVLYPVKFIEIGLPNDTLWEVSFPYTNWESLPGSYLQGTTGNNISFSLPNGTFEFEAYTDRGGYTAFPSPGNVTVNTSALVMSILFTRNPTSPSSSGLSSIELVALSGAVGLAVGVGITLVIVRHSRKNEP